MSKKTTALGTRMKEYEKVTESKLLRRTPVIIRVDGKAFHTYVKRFNTTTDPSMLDGPFSTKLHNIMTQTAFAICMYAQNATFAYTQSDEISILFRDWDRHETEQWFDGKVQKMVSICASMASAYFNFFISQEDNRELSTPTYVGDLALFDARVYNLPFEEVTNYFIWRQKDATRNSINMLGRHYYSTKQLHGKNKSQVQDMLMDLNINWNNLDTWKKRGSCVVPNPNTQSCIHPWLIDDSCPVFTQDREYVEQHLRVKND